MEVIMLKTNYILSLTLLLSIPVCTMERPPRLDQPQEETEPIARPGQAAARIVLQARTRPAPAIPVQKTTCAICFDEKSCAILSCGHKFCFDCLRENIETALHDKQTTNLKCFDPDCKKPFDVSDLRKIINRDKLVAISDIQLKEWLIAQSNIKNCPTPNCNFSFENDRNDQFTMQCPDCKAEYCGQCLNTHSARTTCQQAEQERNLATDRNAQEQANEQWYQANTKPCPRCGTRIEKNEGCMHMQCTHCNPRYHFCWNCLGPWAGHNNFYNCANRTQNPLAPRQAAQAEQIQVTPENQHLLFARDPRGFAELIPADLRNTNFVERFTRLQCEAQDEWAARITAALDQNDGISQTQLWINELAKLEPFRTSITSFYERANGIHHGFINFNRLVNNQFLQEFAHYIHQAYPQYRITITKHAFETSLSRPQMQYIINRASEHFRNYAFERDGRPAPQAHIERREIVNDAQRVTIRFNARLLNIQRLQVIAFLRSYPGLWNVQEIWGDFQFNNGQPEHFLEIIDALNAHLRNERESNIVIGIPQARVAHSERRVHEGFNLIQERFTFDQPLSDAQLLRVRNYLLSGSSRNYLQSDIWDILNLNNQEITVLRDNYGQILNALNESMENNGQAQPLPTAQLERLFHNNQMHLIIRHPEGITPKLLQQHIRFFTKKGKKPITAARIIQGNMSTHIFLTGVDLSTEHNQDKARKKFIRKIDKFNTLN